MDPLYIFYAILAAFLVYGAKVYGRKQWNEEAFSLSQSKALQGFFAVCILLHHAAQKTCAPWHPARYTVHGLDCFVPYGYLFVAVFFFCSGLGLFKSLKSRPDYLKGFVRRRILPVVIAFYVSEVIYTVIRLLMGQKIGLYDMIFYLFGIKLSNFNAWYAVIIPFFYCFFFLAFRYIKKDGLALLAVWGTVILYTVGCALIDHNDYWLTGEWWYNSVWAFPAGMTFARFEKPLTAKIKKFWLILMPLMLAALYFTVVFSVDAQNIWGYYGEDWGDKLKVAHRLLTCSSQWLAGFSFVSVLILLSMKIHIGNRLLAFFGGITLEFYLMHGIFVELFGYNFLDILPSVSYIKSVPLYLIVLFACSVPAALLLKLIMKPVNRALKR